MPSLTKMWTQVPGVVVHAITSLRNPSVSGIGLLNPVFTQKFTGRLSRLILPIILTDFHPQGR
jgi:hypothetical protein